MATRTDWARYQMLRDLIASAIEEAWDDDNESPDEYLIAISKDLDEVHVLLDGETEEVWQFLREYDGWNIESATSYDDACGVADMYFDLR